MSHSVTIVVCAYTLERWTDLYEGVLTAAAQLRASGRDGRVLVTVDHNDDLLARAGEIPDPLVDVVPNARRRGLSGAFITGQDFLNLNGD